MQAVGIIVAITQKEEQDVILREGHLCALLMRVSGRFVGGDGGARGYRGRTSPDNAEL